MFCNILLILLIGLCFCALAALVYIIFAKRFEDRMVGVNLVSTIVLNIIAILTIVLDTTFIIDVTIVYAFLGFLAIVVLCRLLALQVVERGISQGKTYKLPGHYSRHNKEKGAKK